MLLTILVWLFGGRGKERIVTGNMLVCSHVDIFRLNYFSVYCVHFIFAVYSAYNRQMSPNLAKPSL